MVYYGVIFRRSTSKSCSGVEGGALYPRGSCRRKSSGEQGLCEVVGIERRLGDVRKMN